MFTDGWQEKISIDYVGLKWDRQDQKLSPREQLKQDSTIQELNWPEGWKNNQEYPNSRRLIEAVSSSDQSEDINREKPVGVQAFAHHYANKDVDSQFMLWCPLRIWVFRHDIEMPHRHQQDDS